MANINGVLIIFWPLLHD